jgi:hypothetical protein
VTRPRIATYIGSSVRRDGSTRPLASSPSSAAVVAGAADAVLVLGLGVAVDLDQIERRQRIDALEVVVAHAEQERHAGEVVDQIRRRHEHRVGDQRRLVARRRDHRRGVEPGAHRAQRRGGDRFVASGLVELTADRPGVCVGRRPHGDDGEDGGDEHGPPPPATRER